MTAVFMNVRSISALFGAGAAVVFLANQPAAVLAQAQEKRADAISGEAPPAPVHLTSGGERIFQNTCSGCHAEAPNPGAKGIEPPPYSLLKQFPPEKIYEALTTGKMQPMAAALSPLERRQVAEWISGRRLDQGGQGEAIHLANRCATNPPLSTTAAQWNNSGPTISNDRFQSAQAAGLNAGQVRRLKVKWVFAAPNAVTMPSQPVIGGGRVFFSADNAHVYALDARTGCTYWAFQTERASRTAPVYGPIPGKPGKYAVWFGDKAANMYSLDARTGALLWKVKIEDHPRSGITGSPTVYKDKVFVGISAGETNNAGDQRYACCTARGSVVALSAATGKIVWKTYTIAEKPKPRGKNSLGVTQWGPAGASVWNAPTIDPGRRLVYVGTGNAYTLPAAATSDAMLAFDMDTGRLVWSHQEFKGDAFLAGCGATSDGKGNCPTLLGPDYDFGGASLILHHLPNGRDILVGAGKGGVAVAVDPDRQGKVVWRTVLYTGTPPSAEGLVVFGGAADRNNAYFPLQQPRGGLATVRLSDGALVRTADVKADERGQTGPASAIPGVVFTGGWDGILRAVSTGGDILWSYNAIREFRGVNGVPGRGGSFGSSGPAIANGMLFVGAGYIGVKSGTPGNVMIAFAPE